MLAPAAAHLGGGHGHPELGGDGPQLLPVDVPGAVHVEAWPGGLGGSRLGRPRALARGRHERQLDLEDVNAAPLPRLQDRPNGVVERLQRLKPRAAHHVCVAGSTTRDGQGLLARAGAEWPP